MHGYHNKPVENGGGIAKRLVSHRDLAKSDPNGYLTITGPIQGADHPGGQNIGPSKSRNRDFSYAEVIDCGGGRVPHATLGEVPYLFVVAEQGQLMRSAARALAAEACRPTRSMKATHIVSEIPRRIRKDHAFQLEA